MSYKLTPTSNISEIVREYGYRLKGFIRNRVRSAEDAEDILQDVFYQLAEADRLMKPIEQISSWLYTVARNRITDWYRKKKPVLLEGYSSEGEDEQLFIDIGDLLSQGEDTPETEYLKAMIWEELETALGELPLEQREAFELNELQGLSFRDISEITGESENTLISRKRYAVLYLRERLAYLYDELINY